MHNKENGFTLLEIVISMLIISMLVLIVYFVFAVGVNVWRDQEKGTEPVARKEILLRLFKADLSQLVEYKLTREQEEVFFLPQVPGLCFM